MSVMEDKAKAMSQAVAAELRAQRSRAQKTVEQLAKDSGMAKSTLLNYLNGKREIPISAFLTICEVLNVSPRLIFERAEESIEGD